MQLGTQNRKKGDPETLAKNDGKQMMRAFPGNSGTGGGWPLKLVNSILQRTLIEPLSFHFVPQGHGGGYLLAFRSLFGSRSAAGS